MFKVTNQSHLFEQRKFLMLVESVAAQALQFGGLPAEVDGFLILSSCFRAQLYATGSWS